MATMLRIILYTALATLTGINLYLFINKDKDAGTLNTAPTAVSSLAEPSPSSSAPSPTLPPIPVPAPAVQEVIRNADDGSSLAAGAKESFEKGDYKNAADLCKQLAEKNKKASLCAGLSYFRLTDYANAVVFLEQSLESGADEFAARKYLSFAYYYSDKLDKSMSNAEKARSIMKDPELDAFYERLLREKQAHGNFVDESTAHFRVRFDGYEHGGISRKVIGILEDAYSSIGRDMDYFPSEPVTVILYTTHDFHDITQAPGWSGGQFDTKDGKIRVPVRGAEGKEGLLRTVLFHEYAHSLVHSITRNCPLWLNEGLAEYYSKGPQQKVGQVIPLNHLENSFSGLNGRGIVLAYMESHSAASYLMDKCRADRMKGLLFSLSSGSDLNRAFTDSFQMSYNDFIEKWGKK